MTAAPSFKTIESDLLVEEETLDGYRPERYYPATLGQLFHNRYQVVGKLAYGIASTVWLCRDLNHAPEAPTHIAMKIYANDLPTYRELPIYKHLSSLPSKHIGGRNVRQLLESFEIAGPDGKHTCLVHEACGQSLSQLMKLMPGKLFQTNILRQMMRPILNGLQYLHSEAKIVHTDLSPTNVLMGINDPSVFATFEEHEAQAPVPRKAVQNRTIYMSRPMPLTSAFPKISDFSEARFADDTAQNDLIMPEAYRAPENILGMPWGHEVDIWGFGMMLWDLYEPRRFVVPYNDDGKYSDQHHLAQLVAVIGLPPLDFLENAEYSWKYFDRDGSWKGDVPIPTNMSLESVEQRLKGEEKRMFLSLMRKILQWRPEDRPSCEEIFFDEWLCADLIESGDVVHQGGQWIVVADPYSIV
ncbi:hypothetical protein LTR97_007815 [Elasticomyces elasticus]|uniref:EKC/KEOPS complex subunit BUD32 n=1 Tax=Elasticomyces elasticus TaxID=574655 RepID=A0AAN7WCY9_9PEZI|nr:hypothetical protein LTR97_007815 [Elasticomyces elasticus]